MSPDIYDAILINPDWTFKDTLASFNTEYEARDWASHCSKGGRRVRVYSAKEWQTLFKVAEYVDGEEV